MEVWIWLGVGFLFLIGEIFTSGFYLACFSVAAFFTTVFSFLKLGLNWNLLFFAVVSLIFFILVRPFFIKVLDSKKNVQPTNADALIGQTGIVRKTIDAKKGGRVIVRGDDWWAFSEDSLTIPQDTKIIVLEVDGSKLIIKKED